VEAWIEERKQAPRTIAANRMSTCEKPALCGRVPVRDEAGNSLIPQERPAPWKPNAIAAAPPWPR
jgi:hypothetical protein